MLLLASASPARRRLLEQAAIPHRVRVSGVDEDGVAAADPRQLVALLAAAKADAVAQTEGDDLPVLGCDSLLAFEGEVFGKPQDPAEAVERWQRMNGRWAELHTGHCLLRRGASLVETVTTRLRFAELGEEEIRTYVATGEPLACAGGFALESRGGLYVERLEGCWSNVIGLSLPLLRRWLS